MYVCINVFMHRTVRAWSECTDRGCHAACCLQAEFYTPVMYDAALALVQRLDRRFNQTHKRVMTQVRDQIQVQVCPTCPHNEAFV